MSLLLLSLRPAWGTPPGLSGRFGLAINIVRVCTTSAISLHRVSATLVQHFQGSFKSVFLKKADLFYNFVVVWQLSEVAKRKEGLF